MDLTQALANLRNNINRQESIRCLREHCADLSGANLYGANLQRADLRDTNLSGANLYGAYLQRANLRDTNLRGANLRGADLEGADLEGADLEGADLRGSNLRGSNLHRANLKTIVVNWDSQSLLSELLYRESTSFIQQALAVLIAKRIDLCWSHWMSFTPPDDSISTSDWKLLVIDNRAWAISVLSNYLKEDETAPWEVD